MPLTDTRLRALKPRPRLYRVADRDGLCIEVRPTGARLWRFRYRFAGKAQMIGLGAYPEVSLQDARQRLTAERAKLARGEDPASARREERYRTEVIGSDVFKDVAEEWRAKQTLAETTRAKLKWLLETYAYPYIGRRTMRSLTTLELLALIRRPEQQGKIETAHRLLQNVGRIIRYAISTARADNDPTPALRESLTPVNARNHPSVKTPGEIGALLRAIDGYNGRGVTIHALKLAPLVFVRPSNLRHAEWAEIDLDAAEWRIPAEKMKMREPHIVPLSKQAVAILKEVQALTGEGRYVFPAVHSRARPMSENTITSALRRLGYTGDEMTWHGFRSMASTRLHEAGFNTDWIEAQLAHTDSSVRGDYNYALYLQQRRKMMQAWADMLDEMREDRKVVKLRA
ncbi:MAG: tyrosine-type recombinase/integrase [Rhodanobacteraceae bacterium]